jgi:hypothetical protein
MKITREINISLSEFTLEDGERVVDVLSEAHSQILGLGQELGLKRQQEHEEGSAEWEELHELECTCWSVLDKLENIRKG